MVCLHLLYMLTQNSVYLCFVILLSYILAVVFRPFHPCGILLMTDCSDLNKANMPFPKNSYFLNASQNLKRKTDDLICICLQILQNNSNLSVTCCSANENVKWQDSWYFCHFAEKLEFHLNGRHQLVRYLSQ